MTIPTIGKDLSGHVLKLDLEKLLETRLLVQANSGAGKSHLLRRIFEQTAGMVQQIIIDLEGEFASLREKHDFIIAAAHDGDALAHPKTAKVLADRLLETGVSAILDIYDIKKHERMSFVRIFLETVMNAPKRLWHPVLFGIDEIHLFCPEKEHAESTAAVIDLATRGRKRGFALLGATQRIAKFNKDAAAELLNKLIGRTGLDTDVKRAADELGMSPKEAFNLLRNLTPGDFWAFGPALSDEVRGVRVGPVFTTHPKSGQRSLVAPPKPSAAILKVLPQLADLPKEAEAEKNAVEDLRKENVQLKRELHAHQCPKVLVDSVALGKSHDQGFNAGLKKGANTGYFRAVDMYEKRIKALLDLPHELDKAEKELTKTIEASKQVQKSLRPAATNVASEPFGSAPVKGEGYLMVDDPHGEREALPKIQRTILDALAWLASKGIERPQIKMLSAIANYSGGHFTNTIGSMRTAGLLDKTGDSRVGMTEHGAALAIAKEDERPIPEQWMDGMSSAEQKIFRVVVDAHPDPLSRDDVSERSGYSGGHFTNTLGALRTKGAIDYPSKGWVGLTSWSAPQ